MNRALVAWMPLRRRIAAGTIGIATLAAIPAAMFGGAGWHAYLAAVLVAFTALALLDSGWIPAPVIAGQLLAGGILLGPSTAAPLLAILVVAATIATAELLAGLARPDTTLARDAGSLLRRAATAAAGAAAACAVILVVATIPGPGGVAAIILASAACAGLALSFTQPS